MYNQVVQMHFGEKRPVYAVVNAQTGGTVTINTGGKVTVYGPDGAPLTNRTNVDVTGRDTSAATAPKAWYVLDTDDAPELAPGRYTLVFSLSVTGSDSIVRDVKVRVVVQVGPGGGVTVVNSFGELLLRGFTLLVTLQLLGSPVLAQVAAAVPDAIRISLEAAAGGLPGSGLSLRLAGPVGSPVVTSQTMQALIVNGISVVAMRCRQVGADLQAEVLVDCVPVLKAVLPAAAGLQAFTPERWSSAELRTLDSVCVPEWLTDAQLLEWQRAYPRGSEPVVRLSSGVYDGFAHVCSLGVDAFMAVWRQGTTHASDKGIIVGRKSTDGGVTWGPLFPIASHSTLDYRDPCCVQLSNGDILVSFHDAVVAGSSSPTSCHFVRSTDGGLTWGAVQTVAFGFSQKALVSAPIVQLANGNLLFFAFGRSTELGANQTVRVRISTDNGLTWPTEIVAANGPVQGQSWQEPNCVQLANGRLVCLIRTNTNMMYRMFSDDNGATWTTPSAVFIGRGAPRLVRLASGRLVCIHRSDLASAYTNNRAVLHWSTDGGTVWNSTEQIVDAPAQVMAYGGVCDAGGGRIGIVTSAEDGYGKCSVRFRLRDEGMLV